MAVCNATGALLNLSFRDEVKVKRPPIFSFPPDQECHILLPLIFPVEGSGFIGREHICQSQVVVDHKATRLEPNTPVAMYDLRVLAGLLGGHSRVRSPAAASGVPAVAQPRHPGPRINPDA
jgi:hypothetical protein